MKAKWRRVRVEAHAVFDENMGLQILRGVECVATRHHTIKQVDMHDGTSQKGRAFGKNQVKSRKWYAMTGDILLAPLVVGYYLWRAG